MVITKHMRPDGAFLIVLSGELDTVTAPEARAIGLELIAADGCTRFLFDMIDVSFIDSTGLSALVAFKNAAHTMGLPLALLDPSPRVSKVLALTGLGEHFSVEHTEGSTSA